MIRETEIVIEDIKKIIDTEGFIYALCMIIFEDSYVNVENLHEVDYTERLSVKEISLLLGFLIQKQINFTIPNVPQDLIDIKQRTYKLMKELQKSFMLPFINRLQPNLLKQHKKEDFRRNQKDFFGKGEMMVEAMFYSGTGFYDFQYLDFLESKYKYDKEWLFENRDFDLKQVRATVCQIKSILSEKSKKINLFNLKEKSSEIFKNVRKDAPYAERQKESKELLSVLEFHQYVKLFFEYTTPKKENQSPEEDRLEGWKSFYKGLIELFTIRKSDFNESHNIEVLINNFSISFKENLNSKFQKIGNYNLINSHPIIKIDEERYFIPMPFLLIESVYESPFYWMINDTKYRETAGKNRGNVGEEFAYDILQKVFGKDRTFKSVIISSQKGQTDTDIDVLCILGSKALCVQVKSKKLTELSKTGDDIQLQKDFQGAVQDAYEQGLVSRKKILEGRAKIINENGNEINLSEDIDEVYIMGITTENYPSLTHQADIMLEKEENEPYPLISTIFDLELIAHYLKDPYDFLYYIKQRITLMTSFKADEEIVFLGFHLDQKLRKIPSQDLVVIDVEFGALIDRNYLPYKLGLNVSDQGDAIKNTWKNDAFNELCDRLKILNQPEITDIIFHLLDWAGEPTDKFIDLILKKKQQTLRDGKNHNFSLFPYGADSFPFGITYISSNSDDINELKENLLTDCQIIKYKSRSSVWIGFGCLKNSPHIVDVVAFNNQEWKYVEELERTSKTIFENTRQFKKIETGKKIGRNELCYCSSGIKYKKCCGRK